MNCIIFQFGFISIQVMPEKNLCLIFRSGHPIWAGDKDELISILKEVSRDKTK